MSLGGLTFKSYVIDDVLHAFGLREFPKNSALCAHSALCTLLSKCIKTMKTVVDLCKDVNIISQTGANYADTTLLIYLDYY